MILPLPVLGKPAGRTPPPTAKSASDADPADTSAVSSSRSPAGGSTLQKAEAQLALLRKLPLGKASWKQVEQEAAKATADGHAPSTDEALGWLRYSYLANDCSREDLLDGMFRLAKKAKFPADGRVAGFSAVWNRLGHKLDKRFGDTVKQCMFTAITEGKRPDVYGAAHVFNAASYQMNLPTGRLLYDELKAVDQSRGSQFKPYFDAVDALLQTKSNEAEELSLLHCALVEALEPFRIQMEKDEGPLPKPVLSALAEFGCSVLRGDDRADWRRLLGTQLMEHVESHARASGDPDLADWAVALRSAVALPGISTEHQTVMLREAYDDLRRPPLNLQGYASMAGSLGYMNIPYEDKNRVLLVLMDALRKMEARSPDASLPLKLDALTGLRLQKEPYSHASTPTSCYSPGLFNLCSKQQGNPIASFARSLREHYLGKATIEAEPFRAATLRALREHARQQGDEAFVDVLQQIHQDPLLPEHLKECYINHAVDILAQPPPDPSQPLSSKTVDPFGELARWVRFGRDLAPKNRLLELLLPAMQRRDPSLPPLDLSSHGRFLAELMNPAHEFHYLPAAVVDAGIDSLLRGGCEGPGGRAQFALHLVQVDSAEFKPPERLHMARRATDLICVDTMDAAQRSLQCIGSIAVGSEESQYKRSLHVLQGLQHGVPTHPIAYLRSVLPLAKHKATVAEQAAVTREVLIALSELAHQHGDDVFLPQLAEESKQLLDAPPLEMDAKQSGLMERRRAETVSHIQAELERWSGNNALYEVTLASRKREASGLTPVEQSANHVRIGNLLVPKRVL